MSIVNRGCEMAAVYQQFIHRAKIDRLNLVVLSAHKTQGKHLRAKFPADWGVYAQPLDSEGLRFKISIQDPPPFVDLKKCLKSPGMGLVGDIRIDSIEVALDAFPRSGWDEDAAQVLAFASVETIGDDLSALRTFSKSACNKGLVEISPTRRELIGSIQRGATVYIGHRADSRYYKCYIKKTDRDKTLPQCEWCVRFELTLSASELGEVQLLDDLEEFRFERLGKHFPIHLSKRGLVRKTEIAKCLEEKIEELRPRVVRRHGIARRRKKPRGIARDSATYALRVSGPLRRLTSRFGKKPSQAPIEQLAHGSGGFSAFLQ